MKILHATDIHLDHGSDSTVRKFLNRVNEENADVFLLGGDFAQGNNIEQYLRKILTAIRIPVYFVLGNHDYYYGSIQGVRDTVKEILKDFDHAHYLTTSGSIHLTDNICLIGHDAWGDARNGNLNSDVELTDFSDIADLKYINRHYTRPLFIEKLNQLGDEAANYIQTELQSVYAALYKTILVLTHVPPFTEACFFNGKPQDDNWNPYFSCKALGDVLRSQALNHQDRSFLVLSGHTHGKGDVKILPNLRSIVNPARYGQPSFVVYEFDADGVLKEQATLFQKS